MDNAAPARELLVVRAEREAEGVVGLTLADPGGAELPEWEPGAHVDIELPSGLTRSYSLCGSPRERHSYRVAVLRVPRSRGGSAEIHATDLVGRRLRVRGPRNHFPLVPADRYVFIAGGIGITPLLPMLRRLSEQPGSPRWTLLYGGRSLETMAFRREVTGLRGGETTLWPQDSHGLPDLDRALRGLPTGTAVYCCGPEGLLREVEARVDRRLPPGALHTERFRPPGAADADPGSPGGTDPADGTGGTGDAPFEVELRRTGVTLRVPAERRLLDVVREAVPAVPYSCEEGTCGTCETKVLAGVPDHRDLLLDDDEREAGSTMMICVGRSKGPRLVLDL
ncbi:2Fe-2S iron-sulfur cluster binding domain-containing protein [Streptomyces sp. TRM43335]|uniref:2Fe-2S iron-sulfur cluster binding domain-containing protein n=1 Tax=Streptomyces taklimakanensis TaxID=2569853 RepID=A0A6G2BBN4_9ACTN|nr:PDR/VanB family oxidoreductase [Streptomyces taklimakanensis]MTE19473.1 2Fe-2S iron-sulfur cluster binding domain-containing protein [Streptomyces taklimakanensis]